MSDGLGGSIHVGPGKLKGTVRAPASKSFAHRALICAALASAEGSSLLTNVDMSKDIQATMDCLSVLGFKVGIGDKLTAPGDSSIVNDRTISVEQGYSPYGSDSSVGSTASDAVTLNCGESGSTLRFMIPLAAALGKNSIFTGEGRLPSRPIGEFNSIFHHKGIEVESTSGMLPLKISGQMQSGTFHVSGNISSQYITGLLLALPILEGDSEVKLLTPLESAPYIDITIEVMAAFGVVVEKSENGFFVKGSQKYRPCEFEIESDYSQAAFWLTANYLSGDVVVNGLNTKSVQGDKAVVDVLKQLARGANDTTQERTIDASQIPDLVPILAAAAALTQGTTSIINAGRLRIKESDRLASVTEVLTKIGADIKEFPDKLIIQGKDILRGGHTHAWNDHRIAMMLAVVALRTKNGVTIDGYKCVAKSYPAFFKEFARLGGDLNELNLG